MEHEAVYALLEELRHELGVCFEHGLSKSERREAALRELGERFSRCGMAHGHALTEALCDKLRALRLSTGWSREETAACLAALWRYMSLCKKRLEFERAKAALEASPDR